MKKSDIFSCFFIGIGIFLIVVFFVINIHVKIDCYGIAVGVYLIGYIMLACGLISITSIDNSGIANIRSKKKICKCLLIISLLLVVLLIVYSLIISFNMLSVGIFMFMVCIFINWHIWAIVILFTSVSLVRLTEIKSLLLN